MGDFSNTIVKVYQNLNTGKTPDMGLLESLLEVYTKGYNSGCVDSHDNFYRYNSNLIDKEKLLHDCHTKNVG